MPTSPILAVDKAGGTDTFIGAIFALASRLDGLTLRVAALEPQGSPVALPRNASARYFRSPLLHRLLWKFRESGNPIVRLLLLFATAFGLVRIGLSYDRDEFDIVYAVGGPIAAIAGVVVKTLRSRPLAAHFQYTYNFANASRPARFFALLMYRQIDALIGNCGMLGKDAISIGMPAEKCHAVFNWIDESRFRPLPHRDHLRQKYQIAAAQTGFFFGGRFDQNKHVDRIIDALSDLEEPQAVFMFAGDGVLAPQLRALARHNPNVRVLGTLEAEALAELHNACDIGFWNSVDVDYPGLALMEAMASGLPAFTSNVTMNELYHGRRVEEHFLNVPRYARLFPPTREGIRQAVREGIAERGYYNEIRGPIAAFARRRFGFQNAELLTGILAETAGVSPPSKGFASCSRQIPAQLSPQNRATDGPPPS